MITDLISMQLNQQESWLNCTQCLCYHISISNSLVFPFLTPTCPARFALTKCWPFPFAECSHKTMLELVPNCPWTYFNLTAQNWSNMAWPCQVMCFSCTATCSPSQNSNSFCCTLLTWTQWSGKEERQPLPRQCNVCGTKQSFDYKSI